MNTAGTDNKRNYQRDMEHMIEALRASSGEPKTLLLHCCCAPCASYVLSCLTEYFRIYAYCYNPNIFPPAEYEKRLEELRRLIDVMPKQNDITLLPAPYYPEDYAACAAGLGLEPEGGARCTACFRLRLTEAASMAKELGADAFATTLTVSPHKDAPRINALGYEAEALYGVPYLCSDFKKRGGYARSIALSKEYGLYRQNYCGCLYSMPQQETEE